MRLYSYADGNSSGCCEVCKRTGSERREKIILDPAPAVPELEDDFGKESRY